MIKRSLALLCSFSILHASIAAGAVRPFRCELELTATELSVPAPSRTTEQSLIQMLNAVKGLSEEPPWTKVITQYLIPSARAKNPARMITIVGATNVGKSAVLNAIPKIWAHQSEVKRLTEGPSLVSFHADSTARPLILFNAKLIDETGEFDPRIHRSELWRNIQQTSQEGPPLIYPSEQFYRNLIFVDTPAYNGPLGNELVADMAMKSDILIYVFTNVDYASEPNLEFLERLLKANGPRDLILIYNVNAAIPQTIIETHINFICDKLFGKRDPTALPQEVLGAYHMVHDEKVALGEEVLRLRPIYDSMEFADLLSTLDQTAARHRRQTLNLVLEHVLNEAEKTYSMMVRDSDEIRLTKELFDVYIKHLINDSLSQAPYHRLAAELEGKWSKQTRGLRGFAHWLANPVAKAGLELGDLAGNIPAVRELERYLEMTVDNIVFRLRLAVSEGVIRIPTTVAEATQLVNQFPEFKRKNSIGIDEPPIASVQNGLYEIRLPKSKSLDHYFSNYLNQRWEEIVPDIKRDVRENFSNLTLRLQSNLTELDRSQTFRQRTIQTLYLSMAVLPAVIAVFYIALRGTSIFDVRTVAAIVGAHLAAKLFVRLDERSLRRGWNEAVHDWFMERQEPRVDEILGKSVDVEPPVSDPERAQSLKEAIDDLETSAFGVETK